MRRFIFGSDDLAHPWLRWLSVPLLRIDSSRRGTAHCHWAHNVGFDARRGVSCDSVVAGSYDFAERRRRHTASQLSPAEAATRAGAHSRRQHAHRRLSPCSLILGR